MHLLNFLGRPILQTITYIILEDCFDKTLIKIGAPLHVKEMMDENSYFLSTDPEELLTNTSEWIQYPYQVYNKETQSSCFFSYVKTFFIISLSVIFKLLSTALFILMVLHLHSPREQSPIDKPNPEYRYFKKEFSIDEIQNSYLRIPLKIIAPFAIILQYCVAIIAALLMLPIFLFKPLIHLIYGSPKDIIKKLS